MDKSSGESGFTLLEVLAVLAIVALVLAIALPRIGFQASPAATEAAAMRVIAALDEDRYAARRRGTTLASEIDTQQNRIQLATRRMPYNLPATIKLSTRAIPPCDPTGRRVIFYADGTSCAPILVLTSATSSKQIVINALTGAISLGD